jgi:ABC-2 type transport system permease protein
MKYAWLVAWREYAENAKTKGFWLGLLLMPTILFFSAQVPIWLEQKATPTRYFVLVDQSGELAPLITSSLERSYQQKVLTALNDYARKYSAAPAAGTLGNSGAGLSDGRPRAVEEFMKQGGQQAYLEKLRPQLREGAPAFQRPRRLFQIAPLPAGISTNAALDQVADALKPFLRGERQIEVDGQWFPLSAALLIPLDLNKMIVRPRGHSASASAAVDSPAPGSQIQYWSANASEFSLREEVERVANSEIRRREYLARGLDSAAIREVEQTYLPVASLNPKKEKGQEKIGTIDTVKQWAPSGFVYLLWLSIFVIIQMLLNNTIEEKSNRIIEVLLSSVTPGELMLGKLMGIAAIGLTMVGVWMAALFGILSWKSGGASELASQLLTVLKGSSLVPLFSIYFLLGYIMYAAFILSVGSVCNTIKEAQSYMGVLTMVMMVPLMTMTFIPKDPNGSLARVLSWIPLYTPFTMMNRATADPPLIDLIGTLVLLVLSAMGALWMSGKVFRIGILRTGQPPKLVELLRWAVKRGQ